MALQVMRLYVFACDHDGCERYSDDVLPPAAERRKAAWTQAQLRPTGWTFHGRLAFCPDHPERNEERGA